MKKTLIFVSLLFPAVLLTAGCGNEKVRIGQPLPTWSEGCLDIHAINTARGECTFFILPDGTTLTVDAGEFSSEPEKYRNMPRKPDSLTRPTRTYARYMRHFMPYKDSLDYFLLTHFHMDHLGQLEPEYERSADGGYVLSGVTALYDEIPFREIMDRAYPAYDSLACLAMSTASLANYRKFIDYATHHNGLKAAMMRLGDSGQFPLRHHPERYPDFRIKGICANGCVWDGEKIVDCYKDVTLKENGASCGILLSYGDFDYFTAGDAGGARIENPCAHSIGHPVEAMKSHHHLSPHTMQDSMLAVLQPDIIVTQSFYIRDIQPDQKTIRRISESRISGAKRMYFTNIDSSLTNADPQLYTRCAGIGGHIVIRVFPGGKEYCVYMLDDSDTNYKVKQADGPFRCKPIEKYE